MKISIIIPTLDRPKALKELIQKLTPLMNKETELIVVDDSKESLVDEVNSWSDQLIQYISRGRKLGVSSARNIGAELAKGEYLLFFDDDDDFTSDWLKDFFSFTDDSADLISCDMRLIDPNQKETLVSASNRGRGSVIPGAWMIRKSVFERVGGFDERLLFAENTELFFRLDQLKLKTEYINKVNFIYKQSPDGGSKNLRNMKDSYRTILKKHDGYLSKHVKHLYHQNLGVIEMRFGNFDAAKNHLWKSWKFKPSKFSTLMRLGIAFLPVVARRIYTMKINLK